jgi:hypothetical protein
MLAMAIGESNKKHNGAKGEKIRGYKKCIFTSLVFCALLQILLERSSEME